jgi:hypothetical protein
MPAIAFAMTQFVILPKLNTKPPADAHAAGGEADADAAHGDAAGHEKPADGHAAPAEHKEPAKH